MIFVRFFEATRIENEQYSYRHEKSPNQRKESLVSTDTTKYFTDSWQRKANLCVHSLNWQIPESLSGPAISSHE